MLDYSNHKNFDEVDFTIEEMDKIYEYCSKQFPDWKLQRYYNQGNRMLDHIYHCIRKNTAQEMLYKAGLDELAANIHTVDEINLLSTKPSELYEGVSMRSLKAMNCKEGAVLLATADNRSFVKELQKTFPDMFKNKMNDAQCRYIHYMIDGKLTVSEVGRLFMARKNLLIQIWCEAQFKIFIHKGKVNESIMDDANSLASIDPIYKKYIDRAEIQTARNVDSNLVKLQYYLLKNRENYDRKIRRANRKRNQELQERGNGYVVRYPQTINDFCREAIYMRNCLMHYAEEVASGTTDILFMRKEDDFNTPLITIEIYNGTLYQAYHRFNSECSDKEKAWIRNYCARHGIEMDSKCFDVLQ